MRSVDEIGLGEVRAGMDDDGRAHDDASGFRAGIPGHGRRAVWAGGAGPDLGAVADERTHQDPGPVPRRWERSPGPGRAYGDAQRHARCGGDAAGPSLAIGPALNRPIRAGGYQWLYIDGVSDDGQSAIVVIALLGSPFSAHYARARARVAEPPPLAYVALNVAVYGPRASVFALRERRIAAGDRGSDALVLGRSALAWQNGALVVDIDERATPFGQPIRGRILLRPEETSDRELLLDEAGRHRWWPVAPHARIEVALDAPGVRWTGNGYHDANAGDQPLEHAFRSWTWSRGRAAKRTLLTYDIVPRLGQTRSLAMSFERGRLEPLGFVRAPLGTSRWGIARSTLADNVRGARLVRSLEDGPFYTRALLDTVLGGERLIAMHETLSVERLARGWVRFLAGFRSGPAA
jgi:carotenoid 1,2-hydratase